MLTSIIVVHIVLAFFNFLASIVQGIASFGDAVLLQVLWFIVCTAFPDPFNQTPLGDTPVKVVALLMYARVVFSAPYMAYLCLQSGGLFSKSMSLYMAIPSTTTAIIGVYVFSKADGGSLTLFLGISSLIFAVIFTGILGYRYYKRRSQRSKLAADSSNAVAAQGGAAGEASAASGTRAQPATQVTVIDEFDLVANELAASRNASFSGAPPAGSGLPGAPDHSSASEDDDMRTVMSTTTGEVFTRREARTPVINEEEGGPNMPPLTHERLSPTETMTFTRVLINRNLDENGKIKRATKIAAGVAAAGSGIMGSLTGVGAPPQVVFVLWFEVPQYIIRVNFAVQSIPSAVFRFVIAIYKPLFSWGMVPYLANAVISGYVGVFVGNKLGKLLGPNAFNVFVLIILLLSSLLMVTENPYLLSLCTIVGFVVSGAVTWYERKTLLPKLAQQREAEKEMYANRSGTLTEPNRSHAASPDVTRAAKSAVTARTRETPLDTASPTVSPNGEPAGRPLNKSASLNTVDSQLSGSFRRQRNAEKFRPPSLFATPNASPLPQKMKTFEMTNNTATDVVVVAAEEAAHPSRSGVDNNSSSNNKAAALQTEDKPRHTDDEEELI